ncbi:MAG: hypothetical protein JST50_06010 [Bacteroidetes bacterium]|jgi:hypothetical protein|nr:hypothetical protein [Bacteroidota bacterium]
MRLIEIKDAFKIDYGAPCPILLADDHHLRLFFYGGPDNNDRIEVRFISSPFFSFSPPNDEALNGHPYYELGLVSCGFFELLDSDLLNKIKSYGRFHPYYNPSAYDDSHHYIITFKEQLFECIAGKYEVIIHRNKTYDAAASILNDMFNNKT